LDQDLMKRFGYQPPNSQYDVWSIISKFSHKYDLRYQFSREIWSIIHRYVSMWFAYKLWFLQERSLDAFYSHPSNNMTRQHDNCCCSEIWDSGETYNQHVGASCMTSGVHRGNGASSSWAKLDVVPRSRGSCFFTSTSLRCIWSWALAVAVKANIAAAMRDLISGDLAVQQLWAIRVMQKCASEACKLRQ
jgi:hypothetical protein